MNNPLLESSELPPFSRIIPEHIEPAIKSIIKENERAVEALLSADNSLNWESLQEPLDKLDDKLSQAWSPIGHMNAVVNNKKLREAYNNCLPLLSEYSTRLGQNRQLYDAYQNLANSEEFKNFNNTQKKVIRNNLRDFRLAGVALEDDKKIRFGDIKKQLSELTSKFSDNVLDATMIWSKLITDKSLLAGLPDSALAGAKQLAESKEQDGWLLNLDYPSFFPVITYCDNRELRQEVYTAFSTRASDQGPNAGKFDNTDNIQHILKLRHEMANLLGFENYADYSLATKMAESSDKVMEFLKDLAEKSKPQAERELTELSIFAEEKFGIKKLEAWDIEYYGEKLRQQQYAISQEEFRPWFPAEKVITGMFDIVTRLYDIEFESVENADTWHKDVRFYHVIQNGDVIARFYLDIYAREYKRGGAWMDVCRSRCLKEGKLQLPVAYLTCNFTPPVNDEPALLTHNEVVTLFHEFGHGLHHMLTKVNYISVSGISGVAWDAVELPSQFMENWCWKKEGLAIISSHVDTGEPLPNDMLTKLLNAKNFQSAMKMVRQLEFSIFDFQLHKEFKENINVQSVLDSVRKSVAVVTPPDWNRFQNSFNHIFSGGYAAGYYSYKWAEVLSADAFCRFEEEGIFNRETGESFLHEILEQGGSDDPMNLFINFRGRGPEIAALLRHSGISSA